MQKPQRRIRRLVCSVHLQPRSTGAGAWALALGLPQCLGVWVMRAPCLRAGVPVETTRWSRSAGWPGLLGLPRPCPAATCQWGSARLGSGQVGLVSCDKTASSSFPVVCASAAQLQTAKSVRAGCWLGAERVPVLRLSTLSFPCAFGEWTQRALRLGSSLSFNR